MNWHSLVEQKKDLRQPEHSEFFDLPVLSVAAGRLTRR